MWFCSSFIVHRSSLFHPFKDLIVLPIHPQPSIHLLRGGVAAVDVEADPVHLVGGFGEAADVVVQSAVYVLPAQVGTDIDALDTQNDSVAPVTPFRRD